MISLTLREVGEVGHQQRQLDDVVELAARRLGHRAQVAEHLMRLRLDAFGEIAGGGIEAELPGQIDGVAGADACEYGPMAAGACLEWMASFGMS